jgi:carbonic anhydrase
MAEIKKLISGYRDFYKKYFESNDLLYKNLVEDGQSPKTLIIACSDSRVDPSILTNANPGDIFTVRNVANLVPVYDANKTGLHGVSAALEFAVCFLKVKNIVILGHSNCGGIQSLMDRVDKNKTDFIGDWMDIATKAKEKTIASNSGNNRCLNHECEKESIILSMENLLTFPWIKDDVTSNKLKIHGWYFTMDDGKIQNYNNDTSSFEEL